MLLKISVRICPSFWYQMALFRVLAHGLIPSSDLQCLPPDDPRVLCVNTGIRLLATHCTVNLTGNQYGQIGLLCSLWLWWRSGPFKIMQMEVFVQIRLKIVLCSWRNSSAPTEILRQKTRSYGKITRKPAKIRQKFCRGLSRGCMTENMFLAEDGIALTHDLGAQEIQLPFRRPAGKLNCQKERTFQ